MTETSLSAYLNDPLCYARGLVPQGFGDASRTALARFFRPLSPAPLVWRWMKKAAAALVLDGVLPDRPLQLSPSLRAFAYARDGGGITLSLGLLLSRSSTVALTVLCHEMAHVWLSVQPCYDTLKALDRTFCKTFSQELARPRLYAPIEVTAMHLSLFFMEAALAGGGGRRKAKRLARLIGEEREKLASLFDRFPALLHAYAACEGLQ